jgi:hypothetical protein
MSKKVKSKCDHYNNNKKGEPKTVRQVITIYIDKDIDPKAGDFGDIEPVWDERKEEFVESEPFNTFYYDNNICIKFKCSGCGKIALENNASFVMRSDIGIWVIYHTEDCGKKSQRLYGWNPRMSLSLY